MKISLLLQMMPQRSTLTIGLDSTICETYGLAKEGARHHIYTGQRGYHPLLAVAAGTGNVLMARLRKGRADTARGAALRLEADHRRHAEIENAIRDLKYGVGLNHLP